MQKIKFTGAEWAKLLDITILDDDGWRDGTGFDIALLTFDDFWRRLEISTIRFEGGGRLDRDEARAVLVAMI